MLGYVFFYVCLLMIISYAISTTCYACYGTNIFILNGIHFFKNTIFVVVRNEYDFMASNSVCWKKIHSELSTQMNWPITLERATCTFILLILQLINWFGMQWVDLVWHWFWYSTGMVFNLTSTHDCIQFNQFHFIITASRCSAYTYERQKCQS